MTDVTNLFVLPDLLPPEEVFEAILGRDRVLIERIISTGQCTPPGEWLEQAAEEWVVLLQGEAEVSYFEGERFALTAGEYLLIPAHQKHRVEKTSVEPPCIWLAVHLR
jgi:cupin 2 domain-containing protein